MQHKHQKSALKSIPEDKVVSSLVRQEAQGDLTVFLRDQSHKRQCIRNLFNTSTAFDTVAVATDEVAFEYAEGVFRSKEPLTTILERQVLEEQAQRQK